jgi:7-cyano-7-deazaguanine synthase
MRGAVVLTSGGQDSTTCLMWAIKQFGAVNIHTVNFFYGQKHSIELDCSTRICRRLGVREPLTLPVDALTVLGGAALTDHGITVEGQASKESGNKFAADHGLPSTFVPGRNMLFLTLAAAYGAKNGIYDLVTGVCEADDAGYPDCRAQFIADAQQALSSALDEDVCVHAPLLSISKKDTWLLAGELGGDDFVKIIVDETHTCYHGVHDEDHFHDWGYGCGECPACNERSKGFYAALETAQA